MRFLGDRETPTFGINGPYLGPAVRLRRGEKVVAHVNNNISEITTMHWHGLIIPGCCRWRTASNHTDWKVVASRIVH